MPGSSSPVAPLGVISRSNQSGLILILTALSLCFVLVSFAIRVYIRLPQHLWKLDDHVLTAATILSCTQTALVFYEVHIGLGKEGSVANTHHDFDKLHKVYFANNYLYILVLLFSKASVACLYLRLTRMREHIVTTWTLLGVCAVWTILSILLISVGCSWHQAFSIPLSRWLAVGITDCLTDVALVLMAVYLVKDLCMSVVQKCTIVSAFALRLFTIPATAVRLHYLDPSTLSNNRNVAISVAVVCAQIQLGYGLMASSIPVLKPFMAVYEKPSGSDYATAGNQGYISNAGRGSAKMDSMRSANGEPTPNEFNTSNGGRSHAHTYSTNVSHWDNKNTKPSQDKDESVHSHDSRRMIIQRKTDWEVRYEDDSARDAISEPSV